MFTNIAQPICIEEDQAEGYTVGEGDREIVFTAVEGTEWHQLIEDHDRMLIIRVVSAPALVERQSVAARAHKLHAYYELHRVRHHLLALALKRCPYQDSRPL